MRKLLSLLAVLLLLHGLVFAQAILKGNIVDNDGNPIPDVSVTIKGTQTGTTTDAQGHFTITIADRTTKPIIILSAIGFKETAVEIYKQISLTVVLQRTEGTLLSEVIVSGVAGATSKKKITVSITKISEDRLSVVPAQSMVSALSGKVAGIKSSSPSGQPGGGTDLQLRADNNLNNVSAKPLILIDGVILTGSLSDINADDVESMEVVKGAAASALYGSRAGNGVIAITTKRGSRLKLNTNQITIRNEVGFQKLAKQLPLATHHPYKLASDWEQYKGQYTKFDGVIYPQGYTGGGYNPGISGNRAIDADHYVDNDYGVNNNQQDEFYKTGVSYTNFAAVSSRSEKTNIYTSFENSAQGGIVEFTGGYKRQNFRFNLDQQIAPWLKLSTSNLFISTVTNYPGSEGSAFFNIVLAEPDADLRAPNPDGQPFYLRMNQFNGLTTNPIYNVYKQERQDKNRRWIGNYAANLKLSSWANLDVSQSLEMINYRYTSYNPKDTWKATGGTNATFQMSYTNGSLFKYSDESNTKNTQATLNLSQKFGQLDVKGKLSYLFENRYFESFSTGASQFVYNDIPRFANFTSISTADSYIEEEKAQNYFSILSLGWKDKLLFDGMFRYDGSSLFGPDARWNSYYRLSGAYRITQDVKIPGIDELKLRAAYGTAGIRPGFNWQYEVFSLANGVATPGQKGNRNLKPSKTAETEIGLNVDFLKKFNFEAVYAQSITKDQFINVPLIPFVNDGYPTQWQNAGTVKSNTLELSLGANWFKSKTFNWSSNIVFSRIRQKITELPIAPYLYGGTDFGAQQMFYVKAGENYGVMYGTDWVTSFDQMAKQLPAGKTIENYEQNADGYIIDKGTQGTPNERAIRLLDKNGNTWYGKIGDGNSDFNMGISNTITYKGILLYFLIDIKSGGDIYNAKGQWISRDFRNEKMDMSNVPQTEKKTYDYYINFYNTNIINKYWVEDGSYIKLRELAVGYSIPQSSLSFLKNAFKGITAKIIGRNLLTFTKYSGYDPEVGSVRLPYDGVYKYPNFRNIAFSLSFDF